MFRQRAEDLPTSGTVWEAVRGLASQSAYRHARRQGDLVSKRKTCGKVARSAASSSWLSGRRSGARCVKTKELPLPERT